MAENVLSRLMRFGKAKMDIYNMFKEYKKDGGIMTFRQYIAIFNYLLFSSFFEREIIKEDIDERFKHKLPNILLGG